MLSADSAAERSGTIYYRMFLPQRIFLFCSCFSFANTEFAKQNIQHVFDVDATADSPQGGGGAAQIFGGKLGQGGPSKPLKRRVAGFKRRTMTRPRHQRSMPAGQG